MDHGEDRRQVALPGSHEEQSVDGAVGNQPWPHHPDRDRRYLELGRVANYTGRGLAFDQTQGPSMSLTSCANKDSNLSLYL